LVIALAGNANVGKSVIFNYLTGLHQHIGNWPGKTVEKAEGTLRFKDYTIDIVDLPGIYSLSTFSLEEVVSRQYIAEERPDLVINVVDAAVLERNLAFTLQLMELERPMVLALNQLDIAKKKGIEIDIEKLEALLGVPVIPTVAVKGIGLFELLERAVKIVERGQVSRREVRYGKEVEERIAKLSRTIRGMQSDYPLRYIAVKLLEGDAEIAKEVAKQRPQAVDAAKQFANEIENLHKHSCSTVITSERYDAAGCFVRQAQKFIRPVKPTIEERLHDATTHKIAGYVIMVLLLLLIFLFIFTFGDYVSTLLSSLLYGLEPLVMKLFGTGIVGELAWGAVEGLIAGVTIVLPYIIPFYIVLYFLEDSGYLSRVAFLMDNIMHKIGLHGKAFIPMMLGYGCNVPACLGCRVMETHRESLLAAFVTTLIPCAAVTVIIMGLVGQFVGIQWAIMIYVLNLIVIFALGRLAFKVLPGEPTSLIMEMSDYKMPQMKTVLKETGFRVAEFAKIAFPLIVLGSLAITALEIAGLLTPIASLLSPITVLWLGLPVVTGITLIFGVIKKELLLIMLATLLGTTNFAAVLTPVQMIVLAIVAVFYIPCIATIAVLVKEFGFKEALFITLFEIAFAIALGGIALRVLTLVI
jgi:ferrous iron transport protein B